MGRNTEVYPKGERAGILIYTDLSVVARKGILRRPKALMTDLGYLDELIIREMGIENSTKLGWVKVTIEVIEPH